jgi:tetratricopeptide (TPR) repeat protein
VDDRIRVSARLIDAPSGEDVWSDSYEGDVDDVFELQDEPSAMIAAPLVNDFNRAEAERALSIGTDNLEAWSLYQLGLQHALRFSRDDFIAAQDYFTRAVERDPRFATALAQLALIDLWAVVLGFDETPDETIAASLDLARRATALDSRDAQAQAALGFAYIMSGDIDSGLEVTKRAVQLNPSTTVACGAGSAGHS